MQLMSSVEDYIGEAMALARVERFEGGMFVASVPGLEGVIATGFDTHECAEELYRRLENYMRTGLVRGYTLPKVGDIDLNPDRAHILATYHPKRIEAAQSQSSEVFADVSAFKQALARRRAKPS